MAHASDFALPSRALAQPRCPAGGGAQLAGSAPVGSAPQPPQSLAAGIPSPGCAAFLGRPRTTAQTPRERCQAAAGWPRVCIRCPGARLGRD